MLVSHAVVFGTVRAVNFQHARERCYHTSAEDALRVCGDGFAGVAHDPSSDFFHAHAVRREEFKTEL